MQTTNNQSVWDVALIASGSVEAAFEVAQAMGVGVTDNLGSRTIPTATVIDKKVKQAIDAAPLKPASVDA